MAMPNPVPARTVWTAEMLRDLPDDGKRYEIIDGELFVSPAPRLIHQRAIGELFVHLRAYLRANGVGYAYFAPADVEFSDSNLVEPDLLVIPPVEGQLPRKASELRRLRLAIEVLSLSTARLDRHWKRQLYQRERVPEYWIVDCDARLIERWRPHDERPEILGETITWHPEGASEPLVIDLVALFAEIEGETPSP
jgi:Uma2 family endonuclease